MQDLNAGHCFVNSRSPLSPGGALKWESVDVNEVIREMVALLRSEAMRSNISVRMELAADLPQIMGDRVQLQQVTMNLIVNSIDAMRKVDGRRELTIKSQRTEHEQLKVSVRKSKEKLYCCTCCSDRDRMLPDEF
jgi:C4-dicarboxylate-specific signal transduction histidine kinase